MKSIVLACALSVLCIAPLPGQIRRPAANGARVNQTTQIINDCVNRASSFRRTLDRALGRNNVRAGQAREDQLNRDASNLSNQMNKVGDSWNKNHSLDMTRQHVTGALGFARDINVAMRSWNMGGDAQNQWAALHTELNRLARTFSLPTIP